MQTMKEYHEQLEWFWLLCQEEAWQEERELAVRWQLIETTTYGPSGGDGRYYYSVKVIGEYVGRSTAQEWADELNIKATEGQYFSIRKVEE